MGMAQKEGWTVQKAEETLSKVMDSKPMLKNAISATQAYANKYKYVETISGFRRRLDDVTSEDKSKARRAERQAFNARVQGSGAYCTNTALIVLVNMFRKYKLKSKVILTVHDSIVVDCHPDELEAVAIIMKFAMEKLDLPQLVCDNSNGQLKVPQQYDYGNGTYRFPLRAELEIGANYNDDVEYDLNRIKEFKSPWHYARYAYLELVLKEHADYYRQRTTDKEGNPKKLSDVEMKGILKEGLSPEKLEERMQLLEANIKPYFAK